jgi:hypothetical protein
MFFGGIIDDYLTFNKTIIRVVYIEVSSREHFTLRSLIQLPTRVYFYLCIMLLSLNWLHHHDNADYIE